MIRDIEKYFGKLIADKIAEHRMAMEKAVAAGDLNKANGHLGHARGLEDAKDVLKQAIKDVDTEDVDDDDEEDTDGKDKGKRAG